MESPNALVNVTRTKNARTHNMALTNSTSLNSIVDLFFIAGASRTMPEKDIEKMLTKAWVEDKLLTLKTIFWAGNIRGGAGERRFLKIALKWLENNYEANLLINLALIPHFSRWDTLLDLKFENVAELIYKGLKEEKNGLCAKWMPRKKAHDNFSDKFRRKFNLNPKEYRKLIVSLSNTVEQQMCNKEWTGINYAHVPSVAMHKYRKAFFRNDLTRFEQFITKVEKGEEKVNAGVLFPYQLYQAHARKENSRAIEIQWYAMPDYMKDSTEKILPVCDVSGSMYGLPLDISVSLGIYVSERNKSVFKDAFVTFSGSPVMEYLKGTVTERMDQLTKAHWDGNTNLNAVFDLILKRAIKESIAQEDMPTMILIISDMEFDYCGKLTNYENIVEKYKVAEYQIPKIVFWNVHGREGNVPVTSKQKNVAMISGATPAVIKGVLSGKDFSPVGIMLETLNDEAYDKIQLA